MKITNVKKIGCFIIASICLLTTITINLPKTVDSASSQKSIMKATEGITYIENPTVLTSDTAWSGDYIHFGLTTSNKWRVLERKGRELLLYSNDAMPVPFQAFHATSNIYETSSIRSFLNGSGFTSILPDVRERNLVVPSTIAAKANTEFNSDGSLVKSDWEDGGVVGAASTVSFTNPAVNGDSIFLLSVDEITNPNYGFYRSGSGNNTSRETPTDERYWLRSGYADDSQYPALVDCWPNGGAIHNDYESYGQFMVMAATRIDTTDIVYISDSVGGKATGGYGADAMQTIGVSTTNDFKFTLKDTNLKLTLSNTSRSGNTFSFDYTAVGSSNTISAMLFDASDNLISYGRIKDISAASNKTGNASINVPADYDTAGYTLKVFPEQYNGDNATDYVGESIEVTATPTVEKFKVTFKDYDNTVLKEEEVNKGSGATAPTIPTREGYTFTGWDTTFTNITEALVVTAQYSINTYTVTFKNYDGTILKTETVDYNTSAIAPAVPERPGYNFTGWDKSFSNIKNDLTVIAQYSVKPAGTYTVTFKDFNGTVLKVESVIAGNSATPPANPLREGYAFIGWDKTYNSITSDLIITAQYKINTYTVCFKDYDGNILKTEIVDYNMAATPPANPVRVGYMFTGWDKEYSNIKANSDIVATYSKISSQHIVTFKDADGNIIKSESVSTGNAATPPSPPLKDGYTFTGWSQDTNHILGDLEVIALYSKNIVNDIPVIDEQKPTDKTEQTHTQVRNRKEIVDTNDSTMLYPVFFMAGISLIAIVLLNNKEK